MFSFYNRWVGYETGFGIPIIISISLHIFFIVFLFLFTMHSSQKVFVAPVYTVDLVGALPAERAVSNVHNGGPAEKYLKPSSDAEPQKAASKPVAREKAITVGKKPEPSLEGALERIRQRVKEREKEEAVNRVIAGLENKQLEKKVKEIRESVAHREGVVKSVREGEVRSRGIELTERGVLLKRTEEPEEKYAQLIGDIIHDKWNYMGEIRKGEVVVIGVRIDKKGHLFGSHFEESSGNAMFDQSAMKAIEKASPLFPPFPEGLGKDSLEIGVCFPECKKK